MKRILFICHGNICRSASALYIMRMLAQEAGCAGALQLDSAATSREELGNPVYPPMKRTLEAHGVSCGGHHARQMTKADYAANDLLIAMDSENLYYMNRMYGNDPAHKFRLLMDYADWAYKAEEAVRNGVPEMKACLDTSLQICAAREVADPWYTRDFEATFRDCMDGCSGLMKYLKAQGCL